MKYQSNAHTTYRPTCFSRLKIVLINMIAPRQGEGEEWFGGGCWRRVAGDGRRSWWAYRVWLVEVTGISHFFFHFYAATAFKTFSALFICTE